MSLSPSLGQWHQCIDEQETRAAGAFHGCDYGDLLPVVLAAIWHHGTAGHLWSAWLCHARGEHHPINPGQDEHGRQPCHLCLHEQTGEGEGDMEAEVRATYHPSSR